MKILKNVRPLCNTRVMCLWILLVAILSAVGYWIAFSDLWQGFGTRAAELAANKTFITSNSNILHKDLLFKHSLHCDNLLRNMTKGKWIRKADLSENLTRRSELLQEEKRMWEALKTFWYRRGIQTRLWRPDGKCGYDITQEQPPNSKWPHVGTWCNKDGPRPCCNNIRNGTCSPVSQKDCTCPSCFDMRTVVLAELSKWVTADSRCTWRYYFGDEVCDVIAASAYDDITFIGESVTRNMYDALLNLLTEDIVYGSLRNNLTPEEHELCVGPERYYWKECRTPPPNLSKLYKGLTVCKKYKQVPFNLGIIIFMSSNTVPFVNGVKKRLGKEGSLILFGMGIHISCNSEILINRFLKPAVTSINEFYENRTQTTEKWPKILIVATPAPGLLKPPRFLKGQGNEKCKEFNMKVKNYSNENSMFYLDVMPFSVNAFSYDGTHHGFAVNAMKVQLFLNYLAQNKFENQ